jgi:signal transduction histidine kinase
MPYPAHPGPWAGPQVSPTARLVVPAVVALVVQVPFTAWQASHSGRPLLGAIAVLLAVAGPLLLLAARRAPGPVVAAVAALTAAGTLLEPATAFGPPPLALVFAVAGAVARGALRWALISAAAAWLAVVTATAVGASGWSPPRLIGATLLVLAALGVGEFARTRRERRRAWIRAAEQRRQSAEQTERVRIARELHDVLAHSLSSIAVQAGVGLHLMDSDPERARAALLAIRSASTGALDEVRSVIGVLRSDTDVPLRPEPGLDRLPELAETARAAGVAVEVAVGTGAEVPSALQFAVYRIVQEALTNVVRHAKATRASVRVAEEEDAVTVTVRDDGRGLPGDEGTEGSGLLGMRERAELLGGTLRAGPADGGGFEVLARLPKAAVR